MRAAVTAVSLFLAITLAIPAVAQESDGTTINAEALFVANCSTCHEPPIQRAPSREQLRSRTTQDITEALTSGIMQPMAHGLTLSRSMRSLACSEVGRPKDQAGVSLRLPLPQQPCRQSNLRLRMLSQLSSLSCAL